MPPTASAIACVSEEAPEVLVRQARSERAFLRISSARTYFVNKTWEGDLELPPGRPAGQKIQVTFAYDENQVMKCSFLDVESNKLTLLGAVLLTL